MDHVEVTPEAAALLGRTPEQIAKMTIGEFANLIFDRHLGVSVTCGEVRDGTGRVRVIAENLSVLARG